MPNTLVEIGDSIIEIAGRAIDERMDDDDARTLEQLIVAWFRERRNVNPKESANETDKHEK